MTITIACKKSDHRDKSLIVEIIESPTPSGSMQPFLSNVHDKLLMSWTQIENDSLHGLYFSELKEDNTWLLPKLITSGTDWFVNWADFPSIAASENNYAAHYLQKSDTATFAYDVKIKLSEDQGKTWDKTFKLHNDSTKTEHGFVTIVPYEKTFLATWLDGRNTGGGSHNHNHSNSGAMNLRASMISFEGNILNDALIDNKTCDCCQTTATITDDGPIVIYRNRTDVEVRDIYFTRYVNKNWSEPKPVYNDNWVINGCPVNGPKADFKDKALAVAWFTAADNLPKIKVAFSFDNGINFEKPIEIDGENPLGRVDISLLDSESALVSWIGASNSPAELKLVKVYSNGNLDKPLTVSSIQNSRASGFPQMEIYKNDVFMAWNSVESDMRSVKIAKIALTNFD